ncbi:MAG: phospholipid-binding protein MlaC [Geminicoccaceae bacterium]
MHYFTREYLKDLWESGMQVAMASLGRLVALGAVAFVLTISGMGTPNAAQPSKDAAKSHISGLVDAAVQLLARDDLSEREKDRELARLLEVGFDVDYIARFVLGRTYRGLDGHEQKRYRDAYTQYVLQIYGRYLKIYAVDEVALTGTSNAGKRDVVVHSRVKPIGEAPINIDWRIRDRGGSLQIIDIAIEGISQALTQRNEFSSVVSRRGIAGLIDIMEKRVREQT